MLPIVIRGFSPHTEICKIKIKLVAITNKKSSIIKQEIVDVITGRKLEKKIIAFVADNTNLNFGGVRRGQENV